MGFTLIELLVVIGIIGVLVAILMPMLGAARNQARVVACAGNLRSIGMGWNLYLENSNGAFPGAAANMQWFYGGKQDVIFKDAGLTLGYRPLNPYMDMLLKGQKRADVFRCPSDRPILDGQGDPAVTDGYSTYDYFGNSYVLNWLLLVPYDPVSKLYQWNKTFRLGDVKMPSAQVVLDGDCQWYYSVNDAQWDAFFHNRQDRVNLLYLDGHVSYTQIVRGSDMTGEYCFTPWDPGPAEPDPNQPK